MISKNITAFFLLTLALTLGTTNGASAEALKSTDGTTESDNNFWELAGYRVDATPSDKLPGYRPLKNVLVAFAPPNLLAGLKSQFPEIEFVTSQGQEASAASSTSTPPKVFDAVMLSCGSPGILSAAGDVALVLSYSAGVEECLDYLDVAARTKAGKPLIITNSRGAAASVIAEHAIGMTMSLARGLHRFRDEQNKENWARDVLQEGNVTTTIGGKTMLVLGLGAIGKEVARRADALGMKVLATRNRSRVGPDYVDYVGLTDETLDLAKKADVVVNALPLTESTAGIVNKAFFAAMKPTALYVSIGRGGTTDTDALLAALNSKKIAGAGLDVTDPEPLPKNHPLWRQKNVIITPHLAGSGGEAREKTFALALENIRRYQAGLPLLNVVNTKIGY